MKPIERTLLWSGYEDYTGLWQARIEVAAAAADLLPKEACERAREIIESLLGRRWIDLYVTRGDLSNDKFERVAPGDQGRYLAAEASWSTPEEPGLLVWYATTDDGYLAYEQDVG